MGVTHAQSSIEARYATDPPRIDGLTGDPAWEQAASIDYLVQREPNTGEPVSEPTEILLCYDVHNLYIAFRCRDDPEKLTAKELARDANLGYDDRVQIIIDTHLDGRNGYWFQIGPRGSIGDAIVSENGAGFNKAWDGLWDGKAVIHDEGWDAEVIIPFKTLSFGTEKAWGIKFIRHIRRKLESAYWPVANLDTYRFQVSDAGLLYGLKGISQGIGLDITPYALAGLLYDRSSKYDRKLDGGLDVFYQVTPGLKSALTVNTDFAQTEVDDRRINLTRFSLLYPEKRDFFLDGSNYFNFGISGNGTSPYGNRLIPFFSRRIGLDTLGNPVPIIAGGKFTGQAGKWNIGIMDIADERMGGIENYGVARISRNIGKQSSAGIISTFGNAFGTAPGWLIGIDGKIASSEFMGDKNIALVFYGIKSETQGISNGDVAFGGEFVYPNDFLSLRLGHQEIGENFNAGVGFVPRKGIRENYIEIAIGPRPEKFGILQVQSGIGLDHITDPGNVLLTRNLDIDVLNIKFISGDETGFFSDHTYEMLTADFNIYGDHLISKGVYDFWRHSFELTSAKRRLLWGSVDYTIGSFYNGSRRQIELEYGWKISVPVFLGMEFEKNFVNINSGDFSTEIYRGKLDLLFSPDISLSNFLQFDSYSETLGWQSRFRWILTPGRELFFVWKSKSTDPFDRFAIQQADARVKVKYNFRF